MSKASGAGEAVSIDKESVAEAASTLPADKAGSSCPSFSGMTITLTTKYAKKPSARFSARDHGLRTTADPPPALPLNCMQSGQCSAIGSPGPITDFAGPSH